MNETKKLETTPALFLDETARFAERAAEYASAVWGTEGKEITKDFRPADVARIIAGQLAPEIMIAREIAQLEAEITKIHLARALAHIAVLEASLSS